MSDRFRSKRRVFSVLSPSLLFCLVLNTVCPGVNSQITRQSSSADLLKGQTENLVIGSRGTIQLGRSAEVLVEKFENVWSINCIVASGGAIYAGTSPNGGIYRYSLKQLTKIYPVESANEVEKANKPNDSNAVATELKNEHIFAMATDLAGRVLAGISGAQCKLFRFEADKMELVFSPDGAKYIFAIDIDAGGNIYLGTGPEGKVYGSDAFGKKPTVVYDSLDKNILSLAAGSDSFIYAGSDERGLVYKIDPRSKEATVLYDSEQPEITALLFRRNGELCAGATSAKVVETQTQFAASAGGGSTGRPETEATDDGNVKESEGGRKLEIPNTAKPSGSKATPIAAPIQKGAAPSQTSHIYKISNEGFVTDIFSEQAVFLSLAEDDEKLLVGTGNNARLFSVDPASEVETVVYEDEQAVQITAIAIVDGSVYLGTANPAKLIRLSKDFALEGTYISDLIDAGQPAKWGKLQIDGDIPKGCKVLVCSRSGNVKDVNDPTFSKWTEPTEITQPVQLNCPLGRFCQYKLTLQSSSGDASPVVREIAVASTIPNLAPKVESVALDRLEAPNKQGYFKISYKAEDDNKDQLVYKVDFRKVGRTSWIELKDELAADNLEWDGRTVEDGRYEVRVTANDRKSNTSLTELEGSRISDPVVIDNTGPVVGDVGVQSLVDGDGPCKVFDFEVADLLSAIGKVEYTIDSNTDWIGTVPNDLVYDTTDEKFTVRIDTKEDMPAGAHVVTIRASDAVGNITYKTLDVTVGP
ncbi:MAG TPA: hypothetical protein VJJ98_01980 [Sedimentisphaerales bacterium]|nr:hypothetical protein [Sedimentisphaerales bacterium]